MKFGGKYFDILLQIQLLGSPLRHAVPGPIQSATIFEETVLVEGIL